MPPRAAYGSYNPNAGKPANGNRDAWGGYAWPNCPPSSLQGSTDYTSKYGQHLRVTVRRELVPLLSLIWAICDKHNYVVYGIHNGEFWGPWGSECRAISGTSTPSGHSMALSTDINAPNNGYSTTFQCDMPPAMVLDIERCGWYWGGRYEGQKYDPMHFGYCWTPADVARHMVTARTILGTSSPAVITPPTVTTPAKDWFDMATKADLEAVVNARLEYYLPRMMNTLLNGQGNQAFNVDSKTTNTLALDGVGLWGRVAGKTPTPAKPAATKPVAKPTTYTVKATDSDGFNAVAKRLGVTPAALTAANPKVDINNINVGQVLTVPPK